MYSKSEESEEEKTEEEEEGNAVDFILTFVSLLLILITFPFSIWKCIKVREGLPEQELSKSWHSQKGGGGLTPAKIFWWI